MPHSIYALVCTLTIFSANGRFHAYAKQEDLNVNTISSSSEATTARASIPSILVQRDVCNDGVNCSTSQGPSTSVDQPSISYISTSSNNTFILSSPFALSPATSLALPNGPSSVSASTAPAAVTALTPANSIGLPDGPPQLVSTSSTSTEPATSASVALTSAPSVALPSYPTLTLDTTATDGGSDSDQDSSPTTATQQIGSIFSVFISVASQETARYSAIAISEGAQAQNEPTASAIVIGSQTLSPGSTITADGHVFAIPISMASGVVVDDSTTIFPDLSGSTAAAYAFTAVANSGAQQGDLGYSQLPSASGLVIGSQTLSPGSVITAGGQAISAPTGSSVSEVVIVSGSITQTRTLAESQGDLGYSQIPSGSGLVVGSETLLPGSIITAGGETISAPTGSVVSEVVIASGSVAQTSTLSGTTSVSGGTSSSSGSGGSSGSRTSSSGLRTTTTSGSITTADGGEATESATGLAARFMFETWVVVSCFVVAAIVLR